MSDPQLPLDDPSDWRATARSRTPARILVDRSGFAYRTGTWLQLRHDHAVAADAVHAELSPVSDLGLDFMSAQGLFEVQSRASSKPEYLLRPDLGRQLNENARNELTQRCPTECDFQIVIGDGLSASAVHVNVPQLLPNLMQVAAQRGWRIGQTFLVRYCRVGIINQIGDLLQPQIIVLLIGERPGLVTADSLSAYMAFRPRSGHTDAQRNLVSNIHAGGVPWSDAAQRIVRLADKMLAAAASGVAVKEDSLPRNDSTVANVESLDKRIVL